MKSKNCLFVFFLLSWNMVSGQRLFTPDEALSLAMQNNFSVQISEANRDIAQNNASPGNQGVYPTLRLDGGFNYNIDDARTVFSNENVAEVQGAASYSTDAELRADYTIFDGFFRKYNTELLGQQFSLSETTLKATLQNVAYNTLLNYYLTASNYQNIKIQQENLKISQGRLQRAKNDLEFGQVNRLAILNAQVDFNNDSLALINATNQFLNSKRTLENLIVEDLPENTTFISSPELVVQLDKEELKSQMTENNMELAQIEENVRIGDLSINLARTRSLPRLDASVSYNYRFNNNNDASFVATSRNNGLTLGLRTTWDIFDGGSRRVAVESEILNRKSLELQKEELINNLKSRFDIAWQNYENQKAIYKAQEQNIAAVQDNFERTSESFYLGGSTSIDLRQAQQNLINAQIQLNVSKFEIKLAELDLLLISGMLGIER